MSNHRSQRQTANHNQRNQPQLHRPALDQNPPCAHREPDQQSQHHVHSQGYPQPPGRSCIRARAFQLPARIRLGIVRLQSVAQASPSHSGAQGRVRTSVGLRPADLQSAAINHSATCAQLPDRWFIHFSALSFARKISGWSELTPQWGHRGGQIRRSKPARRFNFFAVTAPFTLRKWSWRRDLNPRPSDYKSDALPAELRQPIQTALNAAKRWRIGTGVWAPNLKITRTRKPVQPAVPQHCPAPPARAAFRRAFSSTFRRQTLRPERPGRTLTPAGCYHSAPHMILPEKPMHGYLDAQ